MMDIQKGEKMSKEYDSYIEEHVVNVKKGYEWFKKKLPDYIGSLNYNTNDLSKIDEVINSHDKSKWSEEEYPAYDKYFYGGNRSHKVVNDFNYAWLHHIHANPHHWQHWVLIHDDPNEPTTVLEMPDVYILEMICDWWTFSWNKGNLTEIFSWYDNHKDHILFHNKTRIKVEQILSDMEDILKGNGEIVNDK